MIVVPAKAGTHLDFDSCRWAKIKMDSGFRRNDEDVEHLL
jgi:hypothetical protein